MADTKRRSGSSRSKGSDAARVVERARKQLAALTGREVEGVLGIAADENGGGWQVTVEVVELRLLVASVDRAREMGINWWESDPTLTSGARQLEEENRSLHERLERLEQAAGLPSGDGQGSRARR